MVHWSGCQIFVRRLVRRHPSSRAPVERLPSTHTALQHYHRPTTMTRNWHSTLCDFLRPTIPSLEKNPFNKRSTGRLRQYFHHYQIPYLNAIAGIDYHHLLNNRSTDLKVDSDLPKICIKRLHGV
ncbi:hypothetical protein ZOSMA_38G00250 [Zostera marina]|uniref:Uncharacterized protein n=1 Tax=Zostera marina TaxID=29655 RepID=A0A0K9P4I5_ZOSMR|nr:hypothetical protein ZOSMA_38G00250 [Zostera marina]